MQYLLYPIALYLILIGIRYLITFLQLRKAVLQYPKFQARSADAVPAELRHLFQTPLAQLAAYGFKPCCYVQARSMSKVEPPIGWELLLYHREHKTYAKVGIRLLAEPADLFEIDFYTFFKDRSLLITLNGRAYGVLGTIPKATVQDPYSADLSVQWQMHQEKLSQLALNQPVCALAPEIFLKALQTHIREYLDALVQSRILYKTGAGEFKLSGRTLIKQMFAVIQASKKVAQITQQRRNEAKTSNQQLEIPVELEVQSYQRMEFLQKDLVGRKFRTWLLLGSLALFIVSYTQVFSPERFAIFMAALIFHEGGHLLAMKWFGYRGTALLFLPFFGALATAHKDDATLTQKFWISLAGPLPGLILGIGFLTIAMHTPTETEEWLVETGWILITLNLFNLLPIYPLDGGQIADLLIFSRHPYVGVVFKMIGVLLLALLGLAQPMLFVFAGLIALGIPNSFRAAKITAKLRSELRQVRLDDRDTLLRTIFQHLKQLGHGSLPFAQRYTLAKTLLLNHRELQAKCRTRLALSLLYCGSLLGGIFGTLQAITPNWIGLVAQAAQISERMEQHKAEQQRIVEAATAAIQINPDDSEAYQKRAQAYLRLQNTEAALADYDQVVRLNPTNVEHLMTRARFRGNVQNYQGAVQDYDRILQLEPKNVEAYQHRADYRMRFKDYQRALTDYNTAIQLAPDDYWIYLNRAYIRQELKDFKGVITDANTAIRLEPNQPDAYALRSEARRQIGETQAADLDQQKADLLYETWEEE